MAASVFVVEMAITGKEDAQLIGWVLKGNREAFRGLVEAYQDGVFRVCLHVLQSEEQAKDVAQDTFIKAYEKLRQFDAERGSFETWLLTIAWRFSLNAKKKLLRFPAATDEAFVMVRDMASPVRHSCRAEVYRALDDALANLPAKYRRAFVLAEIEERSYEEIASLEGVAIGTVKSRINRAKARLRSPLQSTFDELKQSLS